jgi:acetate kinase
MSTRNVPDPAGEGCLLVINAGSSSLKALLLDPHDQPLWRGQTPWNPHRSQSGAPNPAEVALHEWLLPSIAPWSTSLALVGHRVVHGGTAFTAPTRVTADVHRQLEALTPLAPLHNGPALALLQALLAWRPALPQWACFDTAFHHTLPPEAFTYAIPTHWRSQGLRRYGFHGLSHGHVSETVRVQRLISCHLGAGCSLCAISNGHSMATTMGFTPLDGLVMATRSGSVDPGLLLHLLRQGIAAEELDRELNHASGWLALSDGLSTDMRELREAAAAGNERATLAIAVFRRRLLEGIGAMAASLGGVDAIALTGGIGEHDQALRQELKEALAWMGPVELVVVPADEEGMIARLCRTAAGTAAGGPRDTP